MGKMFDVLDEALSEALEYVRGNVKLPTKIVFIPDAPKIYKAKDIRNLRSKLKFSQKNFASWLNVSLNTVQAWEQGARKPNHAALRLLEIFDKEFSSVERICKAESNPKKSKPQKKTSQTSSLERGSKGSIAAKSKH